VKPRRVNLRWPFRFKREVDRISDTHIEVEQSGRNSTKRGKPIMAVTLKKQLAAGIKVTAESKTQWNYHSRSAIGAKQILTALQDPSVDVGAIISR
jgi:hypothetical protein